MALVPSLSLKNKKREFVAVFDERTTHHRQKKEKQDLRPAYGNFIKDKYTRTCRRRTSSPTASFGMRTLKLLDKLEFV